MGNTNHRSSTVLEEDDFFDHVKPLPSSLGRTIHTSPPLGKKASKRSSLTRFFSEGSFKSKLNKAPSVVKKKAAYKAVSLEEFFFQRGRRRRGQDHPSSFNHTEESIESPPTPPLSAPTPPLPTAVLEKEPPKRPQKSQERPQGGFGNVHVVPKPRNSGWWQRRRSMYNHGEEGYYVTANPAELERSDLMHNCLRYLFKSNYLCHFEVAPEKILDVGSGSGLWAKEMAESFPNAMVVANDAIDSFERADSTPFNLYYNVGNVLMGLEAPEETFDYVHQRMLCLNVSTKEWGQMYTELHRIMKMDGYLEVIELDPRIYQDEGGGSVVAGVGAGVGVGDVGGDVASGEKNRVQQFNKKIQRGLLHGLHIDVAHFNASSLQSLLLSVGFSEVECSEFRLPLGEEGGGVLGELVQRYYAGLLDSLQPYCNCTIGSSTEGLREEMLSLEDCYLTGLVVKCRKKRVTRGYSVGSRAASTTQLMNPPLVTNEQRILRRRTTLAASAAASVSGVDSVGAKSREIPGSKIAGVGKMKRTVRLSGIF